MKLLKLVIVDDEPILLQGLLNTYEWEKMGFQVVGTAQSGEQAIKVIEEVKPHVVLTDIRMKQITGLMVMEEIQKFVEKCANKKREEAAAKAVQSPQTPGEISL